MHKLILISLLFSMQALCNASTSAEDDVLAAMDKQYKAQRKEDYKEACRYGKQVVSLMIKNQSAYGSFHDQILQEHITITKRVCSIAGIPATFN